MARSSCAKLVFHGGFLVVNLLILGFNISLMDRNKPSSRMGTLAGDDDIKPLDVAPILKQARQLQSTGGKVDNNAVVVPGPPPAAAGPVGKKLIQQTAAKIPSQQSQQNKHISPGGPLSSSSASLLPKQDSISRTWDVNWDHRQMAIETKGLASRPLRRIWLVRHGEYHTEGPKMGHLTDRGRLQVNRTAKRLKEFGLVFDSLVSSTSIRARESSEVIIQHLKHNRVEWSDLLKEGRPGFPVPAYSFPVPNDKSFQEDALRLDEAFKKYIHRADVERNDVINDLIVAHGNVIGYFTLRGLQVTPDRWLKLQVIQGSISMYEITSDGHFNVRILGDMGHIPVADWSG